MSLHIDAYHLYIWIRRALLPGDTLHSPKPRAVSVAAPITVLLGKNQTDDLERVARDREITLTFEETPTIDPLPPTQETAFYALRIAMPNREPAAAYKELVEVALSRGWAIDTDMYQHFVNDQEVTDASTEHLADDYRNSKES